MRRLGLLVLTLAALGTGEARSSSRIVDETSAAAAVAVIRLYYAHIAAHDYYSAYRLWGDGGRATGKKLATFNRGFPNTISTSVTIGVPHEPEGAAGSTYIEIPVTVRARLRDGQRQRFAGSYVLRRVNDVPGSPLADRRWHIARADLGTR
jgi:hypothetical protein